MFASQRDPAAGRGALWGVALLMVAWVVTTGVMWKAYRDGSASAPESRCELVCRPTVPTPKG